MAHLLIIELPGGNDLDIIQAAIDRGDSFTFLTADLAMYQQQAKMNDLLKQVHACLNVPNFDIQAVESQVLAAHNVNVDGWVMSQMALQTHTNHTLG